MGNKSYPFTTRISNLGPHRISTSNMRPRFSEGDPCNQKAPDHTGMRCQDQQIKKYGKSVFWFSLPSQLSSYPPNLCVDAAIRRSPLGFVSLHEREFRVVEVANKWFVVARLVSLSKPSSLLQIWRGRNPSPMRIHRDYRRWRLKQNILHKRWPILSDGCDQ